MNCDGHLYCSAKDLGPIGPSTGFGMLVFLKYLSQQHSQVKLTMLIRTWGLQRTWTCGSSMTCSAESSQSVYLKWLAVTMNRDATINHLGLKRFLDHRLLADALSAVCRWLSHGSVRQHLQSHWQSVANWQAKHTQIETEAITSCHWPPMLYTRHQMHSAMLKWKAKQ